VAGGVVEGLVERRIRPMPRVRGKDEERGSTGSDGPSSAPLEGLHQFQRLRVREEGSANIQGAWPLLKCVFIGIRSAAKSP
jgi:hypothetical protein